MQEVIPKERIEFLNFGEAFVPDATLMQMEGDKHPLEIALEWLTRENPSYSFSGVYDPRAKGARVYWQPMTIGNQ